MKNENIIKTEPEKRTERGIILKESTKFFPAIELEKARDYARYKGSYVGSCFMQIDDRSEFVGFYVSL